METARGEFEEASQKALAAASSEASSKSDDLARLHADLESSRAAAEAAERRAEDLSTELTKSQADRGKSESRALEDLRTETRTLVQERNRAELLVVDLKRENEVLQQLLNVTRSMQASKGESKSIFGKLQDRLGGGGAGGGGDSYKG